jgi:hypothetical protein
MFCPQCGAANADTAGQCAQCGTALQPVQAYAPPPPLPSHPYQGPVVETYLVPSILVTVLCCLPFGIPAIVFASQVQEKLNRGDIPGAQRASKNAKTWCIVSVAVPLVFGVLYLLLMIVIGGMAALQPHNR